MYSNQNITHTKHEKTYQKVEATIYIGMKKQKNVKKNICEIILYMCTYYELESRKYFIYTFEFLFFFLSFWKTLLMLFLKYFT